MDGLDDMSLFKAVVDHGGASAASRHIGIPKSTIARRVAQLERRLGTLLFHRGPRRYALTSFGEACYQQCVRVVSEAEKVFAMADRLRGTPAGSLYVICPPLIGEMLIDQVAAEFAASTPQVRLHLEATTTVLDPRLVSADLVIYPAFDELPDSDLVVRKIFTSEFVLVAAPRVIAAAPRPEGPLALKSFDCLGLGSRTSDWRWRLRRGRETTVFRFTPRFTTGQLSALLKAARLGLGIAALPRSLCIEDLRSGRLVTVLNDWLPDPVAIYAIYPSTKALSLAARRFLNVVVKRLKTAAAQYR